MSDYNSCSNSVILKPTVSSLSGNSADYQSNKWGGSKSTGKKNIRRTAKKSNKKRGTKKCWWKFF